MFPWKTQRLKWEHQGFYGDSLTNTRLLSFHMDSWVVELLLHILLYNKCLFIPPPVEHYGDWKYYSPSWHSWPNKILVSCSPISIQVSEKKKETTSMARLHFWPCVYAIYAMLDKLAAGVAAMIRSLKHNRSTDLHQAHFPTRCDRNNLEPVRGSRWSSTLSSLLKLVELETNCAG